MEEDKVSSLSVEEKRPIIVHAFRRSSLRKKIAEYLYEISPSSSYPSEIAYHVKSTPTNVLGALRGMEPRYRSEESLLNLSIVEAHTAGQNMRLYKLTEFGREIVSSLKGR